MTLFFKNRTNLFILISAVIFAVGTFVYTKDVDKTVFVLSAFSGVVIIASVLFFNLKWYYLILVGLIPISIEAELIGSAQISFPSEGMLVLLVPIVLLFNKEYQKAIIRISSHPITILLGIDLLIEIFTSLTGTHIDVSLKRVFIRFLYIMVFYVMVHMITNKKELKTPWMAYILGLIPVMYFTMKMHVHYDFNPKAAFAVCQPYFDDHTIYGASLAFIIPVLFLFLKNKVELGLKSRFYSFLILVFLLIVVSEFLALSRAAILSLGTALIFYWLLKFKVSFKNLMGGLGVFVVIGVLFSSVLFSSFEKNKSVSNDGNISNHLTSVTNVQNDASNLERINRWICAVRMFQDRPLLGFGPGTYQFEYNQYQTIENKTYISTNSGNKGNAHSEYLTYLSETGIIGLIVYLLTIFSVIYYGMQNHYQLPKGFLRVLNLGVLLGLVSYFFHGIFNSFIDQSKIAFLYFTGISTIVWINMILKKEQQES